VDADLSGSNHRSFTIAVRGEVDLSNTGILLRRLIDLAHSTTGEIALDLTQVDFMDCAGLRMLAAINQHIKTRGGSMRVVAASPAVTRLFELIASSIAPLEYHMLHTVRSAASTPTLP
jgi:anti-anti-sigma factor